MPCGQKWRSTEILIASRNRRGARAGGRGWRCRGTRYILWSLILSKEHFFPRFDVISPSQKHETPVIMLMFIFTVSINHINWIIADCRGYGPGIIWSMKSAAPIIQLIKPQKWRENSSINLSLWIPHLGFNLHRIEQRFSSASTHPLGVVC